MEVTPISAAVGSVAFLASARALFQAYGSRNPAQRLDEIKGILYDIEVMLMKIDKIQNAAAVDILPVIQRSANCKVPAHLEDVMKRYVHL